MPTFMILRWKVIFLTMMSFKFNIFFLFRKTSEQKSAIKDGIRAMSQGCSLLGFVIAKLTTLVRSLLHATLFCKWGYQRVNKIVKFKWKLWYDSVSPRKIKLKSINFFIRRRVHLVKNFEFSFRLFFPLFNLHLQF